MKKINQIICFVLIGLFNIIAQAQQSVNLIKNGSFEDKIACPSSGSGTTGPLNVVMHWINPCTGWPCGTPDYFNTCGSSDFRVPKNYLGYQFARTGSGYCGVAITSFHPDYLEFREYIETELDEPLTGGSCYRFEMYINSPNKFALASDAIQVLFSNTLITVNNSWNRLNFTPQLLNSTGNYPDTSSWKLMSGVYTAKGGEKFITIGNFFSNANSSTITVGGELPKLGDAYIYIDDVTLTQKFDDCITALPDNSTTNNLKIFPNPTYSNLKIIFSALDSKHGNYFTVKNALGHIVLEGEIFSMSAEIQTKFLKPGIYQIQIQTDDGCLSKKFIKSE